VINNFESYNWSKAAIDKMIIPFKCPRCGAKTKTEWRFCGTCGVYIPAFCLRCNSEVVRNEKYCRNCGISLIGRQFNPVSLMIIFFSFSLVLLKINKLNPFEVTQDINQISQLAMFWMAILGEIVLIISLFWKGFRVKISNMTSWYVIIYMGFYILSWLYSFTQPDIFSDNPIIRYYVSFGGGFFFLLLTFFSCIRLVGSNRKNRFIAFVVTLVYGLFLFFQFSWMQGSAVLLLSLILLTLVIFEWNVPDYFPV
jgi:hypothetical protein